MKQSKQSTQPAWSTTPKRWSEYSSDERRRFVATHIMRRTQSGAVYLSTRGRAYFVSPSIPPKNPVMGVFIDVTPVRQNRTGFLFRLIVEIFVWYVIAILAGLAIGIILTRDRADGYIRPADRIKLSQVSEAQAKEESEPKTVEELIAEVFGAVADEAITCFKAESGLRANAINTSNRNKTWDFGIAQVNSVHCPKVNARDMEDCKAKLMDVRTNLQVAKQIYDSRGWQAWYACRNLW